jgi:2-polyprenyl-3-methyl-5-hydroxy-6-metoxy-1,4-benzoquinol methylase
VCAAVSASWKQGCADNSCPTLLNVNLQEQRYQAGADYRKGSPHLSHPALHDRLVEVLRGVAVRLDREGLPLRVLEIGAGHGGFTEPALALGCDVTAVDMSGPSIAELRRRLGINPKLRLIHSPDGALSDVGGDYTLLMCVSVLHHIPDYVSFLAAATELLAPGAALLTLQDPTWYPRHRAAARAAKGTYFAWRLVQGNLTGGVRTRLRRMSGLLDETNPADMVEYHLMRNGVDEDAVISFARERFAEVTLIPYWSTHLGLAHGLGERLGLQSSFGVVAHGYGAR